MPSPKQRHEAEETGPGDLQVPADEMLPTMDGLRARCPVRDRLSEAEEEAWGEQEETNVAVVSPWVLPSRSTAFAASGTLLSPHSATGQPVCASSVDDRDGNADGDMKSALALFAHGPLLREALGRALFVAASQGQAGDVRRLLARGADVRYKGGFCRTTALHEAAGRGHAEAVAALVDAGAPLDAADETGFTALHYAAQTGNESCVCALLRAGADANARDVLGGTPMHYAALSGSASVVRALLRAGADASAKDKHGRPPFRNAKKKHRWRCVVS